MTKDDLVYPFPTMGLDRDDIAIKAITGVLTDADACADIPWLVSLAYEIADEMIKQSEESKP